MDRSSLPVLPCASRESITDLDMLCCLLLETVCVVSVFIGAASHSPLYTLLYTFEDVIIHHTFDWTR